jgi:D-serine deaminase-like pyridoxal phosphate-dependent protein
VAQVPGVTEVRAGTYVFYDLMQLGFGSCTPDDLALSVLCTVVSDHGDRVTIDGGSKTFSGDRGVIGGASVAAKGVAKAVDREAWVERLTEEHGMIALGSDLLDVGEKVAFYPTHACTCINLSDVVHGVRDGVVEVVWQVDARGQRA